MPDPQSKRLQTIAAKVETTPGTAVALAAADGELNAYEIECQADIPVQQREGQGGFDMLQGVPGPRQGTLNFRTDLEWSGSATLPFWASVLLPACGWVPGIPDVNSFTPRSEGFAAGNVKTLTMARFIDGVKKQLAGAVGNFRFVYPAGEIAYIEWEFRGIWEDVIDTPIITPSYPRDFVSRYADAVTQYAGVDLCLSEITFDAGNEVVMRECAGKISGFESGFIPTRHPIIEGDPEAQLIATRDDWGDWLSGRQDELTVQVKSGGSGTITLTAPQAQYENVQEGDRNQIEINNLTWRAQKNQAIQDQSLIITFAPTPP